MWKLCHFFLSSVLWVGLPQLDEELASLMLTDSKLRPSFVSWLAGECRVVGRKRNRLALSQTLLMKAGGSSRSSLELASRQVRFVFISFSRCLLAHLCQPQRSIVDSEP